MSKARVGIALISFAHDHAHHWARAIRRSAHARLVSIWDDDAERGEQAATEYGTPYVHDLHALLADPDVQAVGICSENSRHADMTVLAAEHGKDVLCEKPMATTLEDCDRMIAACEKAGVRYMQTFPKRFDPAYIKIKELIDSGSIGRIGSVRMRHGHYFALVSQWMNDPNSDWIRDPVLGGGGALMDEGVHGADCLRWLFGEPASVIAEVDTLLTDLPVDDNSAAIWRFENGVLAVQQSNWTDWAADNTLEIYGESGMIVQRHSDCSSTRIIGEGSSAVSLFSQASPTGWIHFDCPVHFPHYHETVMEKFIDCLIQDAQPPVSGLDGRKALEMILGAYRSAKENRQVRFPLTH